MVETVNVFCHYLDSHNLGLPAVLGELPGVGFSRNFQEVLDRAGVQSRTMIMEGLTYPEPLICLFPFRPFTRWFNRVSLFYKFEKNLPFSLGDPRCIKIGDMPAGYSHNQS